MKLQLGIIISICWSCACSSSAPPTLYPVSLPPKIHVLPLPGYIMKALQIATGMLGQAKNPILPTHGGVIAVSRASLDPDPSLMIQFVYTMKGDVLEETPDVCDVRDHPVEVCEYEGPCVTVDPTRVPVIFCSWSFVMELDALIRIGHDTDQLQAITASDQALAAKLSHLHDGWLPARDVPQIEESHLTFHWLMVFLFLLAHESRHLNERDSNSSFASQFAAATRTISPPDLAAELVCRNKVLFEAAGWSAPTLRGQPVLRDREATDGATTPAVQSAIDGSIRIWKQEIDADMYALGVVESSVELMASDQDPSGDYAALSNDLRAEFAQDLALLGLRAWSMRTSAFLAGNCAELRESRFALTRCMCRIPARDYRRAAMSLLDANHPPMLLRVALVISRQFKHYDTRMIKVHAAPTPH